MVSGVARVLQCRDIMGEIFEQMSPGWLEDDLQDGSAAKRRRKAQRRALASCARTCHAFLDQALDVLWRVLDDVDVVLLRLLPSSQMASRPRQEPQYVRVRLSSRDRS